MSHTAVSLTKNARTTRPSATRRTPSATPRVMPLWQAMAHLFTPADGTVRP
ncbi:hypothetical protein OG601_14240 [Streptomyces sp. NBC_01239]|uniref:hypothetical protein n=1 Tax=Streptomyces sp. NBC_01239 TaxID=2903792 RepID=UPI002258F661|nr:hypothetical protein [Streptomyces sp. NBC_01239]MCX4811769.1 hypothetical protein [Streptomyces sp. NBC_01239]